jgi:hypothetical protein
MICDHLIDNHSHHQALPLIEDFDEFKALDDEARREAFDKFIKRQKVSECMLPPGVICC